MAAVGIRELKTHLSAYVKRAQAGERIVVLERGREVAELGPLGPEHTALQSLVLAGDAKWAGGKPKGLKGIRTRGEPLSETVLEDRR